MTIDITTPVYPNSLPMFTVEIERYHLQYQFDDFAPHSEGWQELFGQLWRVVMGKDRHDIAKTTEIRKALQDNGYVNTQLWDAPAEVVEFIVKRLAPAEWQPELLDKPQGSLAGCITIWLKGEWPTDSSRQADIEAIDHKIDAAILRTWERAAKGESYQTIVDNVDWHDQARRHVEHIVQLEEELDDKQRWLEQKDEEIAHLKAQLQARRRPLRFSLDQLAANHPAVSHREPQPIPDDHPLAPMAKVVREGVARMIEVVEPTPDKPVKYPRLVVEYKRYDEPTEGWVFVEMNPADYNVGTEHPFGPEYEMVDGDVVNDYTGWYDRTVHGWGEKKWADDFRTQLFEGYDRCLWRHVPKSLQSYITNSCTPIERNKGLTEGEEEMTDRVFVWVDGSWPKGQIPAYIVDGWSTV